jgi:hypothetical protein
MELDMIFFQSTRPSTVNLNTHQKFCFCARLQMAAGVALYIFHAQPGTAN